MSSATPALSDARKRKVQRPRKSDLVDGTRERAFAYQIQEWCAQGKRPVRRMRRVDEQSAPEVGHGECAKYW